jgi:hypothetical protein
MPVSDPITSTKKKWRPDTFIEEYITDFEDRRDSSSSTLCLADGLVHRNALAAAIAAVMLAAPARAGTTAAGDFRDR